MAENNTSALLARNERVSESKNEIIEELYSLFIENHSTENYFFHKWESNFLIEFVDEL